MKVVALAGKTDGDSEEGRLGDEACNARLQEDLLLLLPNHRWDPGGAHCSHQQEGFVSSSDFFCSLLVVGFPLLLFALSLWILCILPNLLALYISFYSWLRGSAGVRVDSALAGFACFQLNGFSLFRRLLHFVFNGQTGVCLITNPLLASCWRSLRISRSPGGVHKSPGS